MALFRGTNRVKHGVLGPLGGGLGDRDGVLGICPCDADLIFFRISDETYVW